MLVIWKVCGLLAVAALAAGCVLGRTTGPPTAPERPGQPAQSVPVGVVLREFEFEPRPLRVKAGTVRFLLLNRGRGDHDFAIPSLEGTEVVAGRILKSGRTQVIELSLKPGTYLAICRLPGHREAGMMVTLEVSP